MFQFRYLAGVLLVASLAEALLVGSRQSDNDVADSNFNLVPPPSDPEAGDGWIRNKDPMYLFRKFIARYKKKYSTTEWKRRFNVFARNLVRIEELNADLRDGATYGITEWADMEPEEFQSVRLVDLSMPPPRVNIAPDVSTDDLPESWDWRTRGAVTPVRNQGTCGSCWAFSAVENIEGQTFLATGELVPLSPQQIVDCDARDCACYGGFPSNAFSYVAEAGGLMPEADYTYCVPPYGNCFVCLPNQTCNSSVHRTWYCNHKCAANPARAAAKISSFITVSQDEAQIAAQLVRKGPLSVLLNANHLMFYRRGVSRPWFCNREGLNHAVLLVGYGVDEHGHSYWTLKNSWGDRWGENGYFRLFRGHGTCGINTVVTSAVV